MMRVIGPILLIIFLNVPQCFPKAKSSDGIKKKIISLAKKTVKSKCQRCKVTVQCKWISPSLRQHAANDIRALYFSQPGLPSGYVTAQAVLNNAGKNKKPRLQLYVSIQRKVAVAQTNIKRGAAVANSNISWKWKFVSKLSRQPVINPKDLRHTTATRMIRKGNLIFEPDLAGTGTIKAGDHVLMIFKKKGVGIHFNCIARQRKHVGQKIRLFSKQTGRMYLAKVKSKNKIIWVKTL